MYAVFVQIANHGVDVACIGDQQRLATDVHTIHRAGGEAENMVERQCL